MSERVRIYVLNDAVFDSGNWPKISLIISCGFCREEEDQVEVEVTEDEVAVEVAVAVAEVEVKQVKKSQRRNPFLTSANTKTKKFV